MKIKGAAPAAMDPSLYERIAKALSDWTLEEVKSFSLNTNREVEGDRGNPELAAEIDEVLRSGSHLTRGDLATRRYSSFLAELNSMTREDQREVVRAIIQWAEEQDLLSRVIRS